MTGTAIESTNNVIEKAKIASLKETKRSMSSVVRPQLSFGLNTFSPSYRIVTLYNECFGPSVRHACRKWAAVAIEGTRFGHTKEWGHTNLVWPHLD
jgi:hypothetical protein